MIRGAKKLHKQLENILHNFQDYLAIERRMSPKSVESYMSDAGRFLRWAQARKLAEPGGWDRAVITQHLAHLRKEGKADTTIRRHLAAFRALSRFLVREEVIDSDFTADISQPAAWKRLPKVLSDDEIARLLAAPEEGTLEGVRDGAMLELLYATGIRVSELVNLKLTQLQFQLGTAFALVHGKGDKDRLVPVGDLARERVEYYLEGTRPLLLKGRASDFVFVTRRGGGMTRQGFWARLRHWSLQADIGRRISPHMLRHSFATHLVRHGADLRSVQAMLGHADISTTEVYTQVDRDALRRAIDEHHPRGRPAKGANKRHK